MSEADFVFGQQKGYTLYRKNGRLYISKGGEVIHGPEDNSNPSISHMFQIWRTLVDAK